MSKLDYSKVRTRYLKKAWLSEKEAAPITAKQQTLISKLLDRPLTNEELNLTVNEASTKIVVMLDPDSQFYKSKQAVLKVRSESSNRGWN